MAAPSAAKSQATVFYSWQSDLPNATNRSLILDALDRAAKKIRTDDSVTVEPVVDRDTQDIPGAPDIAHTIFQKIDKAAAFVADVSIINPGIGRPTPNPNVLIELGYALRTLGNPRTVLVANTVNGPVESLPFDLRTKRVLTYHLPPNGGDKPDQRKKLQDGLEAALRAILSDTQIPQVSVTQSAADKAIESIEAMAPSQSALCSKFMSAVADRVKALTPTLEREKIGEWDEDLVQAIRQSVPLATDFARVADAVGIHDSRSGACGLFQGFAPLLSQYYFLPAARGAIQRTQFDFPKFVGHELMVMLFAPLIRERRWAILAELCKDTIVVSSFSGERPATYLDAREPVALLNHRNARLKLNRISLHADILKERHETGQLGELSPWRQFLDADVFLYLRSFLEQDEVDLSRIWFAETAPFLEGCPRYLLEAVQREKAEKLLDPLGVKSLDELRRRLKEAPVLLKKLYAPHIPFYDPFQGLKPDLFGTK